MGFYFLNQSLHQWDPQRPKNTFNSLYGILFLESYYPRESFFIEEVLRLFQFPLWDSISWILARTSLGARTKEIFQFPLWDSISWIQAQQQRQRTVARPLSIPFMGFYFLNRNQNFSGQNFSWCTFNSLYGILFLESRYCQNNAYHWDFSFNSLYGILFLESLVSRKRNEEDIETFNSLYGILFLESRVTRCTFAGQ